MGNRNIYISLIAFGAVACTQEVPKESTDIRLTAQALEFACTSVNPDAVLEWQDPMYAEHESQEGSRAEPQDYGNESCSGFTVEMSNPNGWMPEVAFVQGGGYVTDELLERVFGTEERCQAMTIEGDIWGYSDGVWLPLVRQVRNGVFEMNKNNLAWNSCDLAVSVDNPGYWERYRFAGRISDGVNTFPFRSAIQ